ncbi:MAG: hypothetical protein PVH18_09915, partial [Chloroflexota bacterium]
AAEFPSSLQDRMVAAWQKREPRWYDRLAPAQKHWVDKLVATRLREFEEDLTALDREDSQLARQIAEVSTQLRELNRRLTALEQRVDGLELGPSKDESG